MTKALAQHRIITDYYVLYKIFCLSFQAVCTNQASLYVICGFDIMRHNLSSSPYRSLCLVLEVVGRGSDTHLQMGKI